MLPPVTSNASGLMPVFFPLFLFNFRTLVQSFLEHPRDSFTGLAEAPV